MENSKKLKRFVFSIKWTCDVEDLSQLSEIISSLNEYGSGEVVDAEVIYELSQSNQSDLKNNTNLVGLKNNKDLR